MTKFDQSTDDTVARATPASQALVHHSILSSNWLEERINEAIYPFSVSLKAMPEGVKVVGRQIGVDLTAKILTALDELDHTSGRLDPAVADAAIEDVLKYALSHDLSFRLPGLPRPLRPLTLGQLAFMGSLLDDENRFVIGVGSTGTGKTHIAMAAGLNLLEQEAVKSMIITRPHVVRDGEVVTAKVRADTEYGSQFLPIEDELRELVGHEEAQRLLEHRKVEITPLGRMRGRTFNDSFVYIDEAQNASVRMLRMALTRTGQRSRLVVTGDPAQVDLIGDETSGLAHLLNLLEGTDLALIHRFKRQEIVRSDLVAQLEALYEDGDGAEAAAGRVAA